MIYIEACTSTLHQITPWMKKLIFFCSLTMLLFFSYSFNTNISPSPHTSVAPPLAIKAEKLYDSLKNPWAIAWLPDGRMLITERAGEILVFRNNTFTGEKLTGLPAVKNKGQGGLLDLVVHPQYNKNGWLYITFSKPVGEKITTAVVRFKLKGNEVVEKQEIFEAKPYLDADYHFGSRIVFDDKGYMFLSVGERGTQPKVQELDNDHGKIHRLYDDGKIPQDNPFVKTKGAHGSIWTYGHRNPQGMIFDPSTKRLWAMEHGPRGGDELNLIEKGNNYGWPKTSYGINYDGSVLTKFKQMKGITDPVHYWVPSIGPCGMTMVTSNKYPEWKNNLLVTSLAFRHLARVEMNGAKYVREEKLLENTGRFRDIKQGPDGLLYAITEGPGLLLRLDPVR